MAHITTGHPAMAAQSLFKSTNIWWFNNKIYVNSSKALSFCRARRILSNTIMLKNLQIELSASVMQCSEVVCSLMKLKRCIWKLKDDLNLDTSEF